MRCNPPDGSDIMPPDAAAEKRSAHPTGKQPRFTAVSDTSGTARLYSFVIAWAIRIYCLTLRFRVDDRGGMHSLSKPVIWAIWHNRLFPLPVIYLRIAKDRLLSGLTSPSTDGAILSAVLRRFGIQSVRGSSNKRAAQSLVECRRRLMSGSDLAITPDGQYVQVNGSTVQPLNASRVQAAILSGSMA